MKAPLFVEVYGCTDAGKTRPIEGTVKVGDGLAIFVGLEKDERGLLVMLRSVLAAMHLSNAIGLTRYDVARAVKEALADGLRDERCISTVVRACMLHTPGPKDNGQPRFAAWFTTPDRSEGTNTPPALGERASGHTCSPADSSRREDQGDA